MKYKIKIENKKIKKIILEEDNKNKKIFINSIDLDSMMNNNLEVEYLDMNENMNEDEVKELEEDFLKEIICYLKI